MCCMLNRVEEKDNATYSKCKYSNGMYCSKRTVMNLHFGMFQMCFVILRTCEFTGM